MTYDPIANAAYVYIADKVNRGEAVKQLLVCDGNVVIDLDKDGHLLGVEVIVATLLLRPETLARAERI